MKKSGKSIKLPKKIAFEDIHKYELALMKESLLRSGIEVKDESKVLDLVQERNLKENVCVSNRPPLPCDYIGNEKWIGHGFFYKSGLGSTDMTKDNAWMDFDCFDNFRKLSKCKVLLADYDTIREDFQGPTKGMENEEIDNWLISQSCFISTGQMNRMKKGGDLHELVDPKWIECVDEKSPKVGVRQRGGGRACTFFVDDEITWDDNGRMSGCMVDCKGIGTTEMQKETEKKASGFLSYADALKGFIYERAIRKALEHAQQAKTVEDDENQQHSSSWDTVKCYAIIDIGIRWKSYNPATGIEGDTRNVILLRAGHSRYLGCKDDPVYYSVVRMDALKSAQGERLIQSLRKVGISSEQVPFAKEAQTWNVQCTAKFDRLVDFSHWYFVPDKYIATGKSPNPPKTILPAFRMTLKTFVTALRMQGKFLFGCKEAMSIAYDTEDEKEAMEKHKEMKNGLEEIAEGIGKVGDGKPKYSWSWLCEMDDSVVMKMLLDASCEDLERKVVEIDMQMIKKWTDI